MELYLKHGEREFTFSFRNSGFSLLRLLDEKLFMYGGKRPNMFNHSYKLTPKAIEYIKNLDNP